MPGHAQLSGYIISCNAHSCGLQVTLGLAVFSLSSWVSLFGGMERWNRMVEWNGGME